MAIGVRCVLPAIGLAMSLAHAAAAAEAESKPPRYDVVDPPGCINNKGEIAKCLNRVQLTGILFNQRSMFRSNRLQVVCLSLCLAIGRLACGFDQTL